MENKNIIIILIAVIVVLAACMAVIALHPFESKEPSIIKITSNNTLTEGGNLSVQLTDLNKTPISKGDVNVTITDSKGKVVLEKVVKTNSNGKAKMDLDLKKGKYNVTVSFGGNENYTGNNTTQKLTIKEKEKAVEETPEITLSDANSNANSAEQVDYNSPNSEYYRWDTDGSYHKKQEGGNYIYAQDAFTGEWSYWANKT